VLIYPNVENQSSTNDRNRFPLTGTIDEIGMDIEEIKDMGVDHIVFGYNFVSIGRDVDKMQKNSQSLLDKASKLEFSYILLAGLEASKPGITQNYSIQEPHAGSHVMCHYSIKVAYYDQVAMSMKTSGII
jgi:hypothetical protein